MLLDTMSASSLSKIDNVTASKIISLQRQMDDIGNYKTLSSNLNQQILAKNSLLINKFFNLVHADYVAFHTVRINKRFFKILEALFEMMNRVDCSEFDRASAKLKYEFYLNKKQVEINSILNESDFLKQYDYASRSFENSILYYTNRINEYNRLNDQLLSVLRTTDLIAQNT